jgi:predicted KAP-like P-loop ATPase
MAKYSSDKPIDHLSQDKYSRKEYAKRIGKLLSDKRLTDNYVIGLYSPWGYGKTSTLHMIEESIGDKALVIRFNPWIFENPSAIIMALLFELAEKLDEPNKPKNFTEKVKRKLTRNGSLTGKDTAVNIMRTYTGAVGVGLNALTSTSLASVGLEKTVRIVEKHLKTSGLGQIKNRIEKKVKDYGKRVIIIVDDVDRLDKDEVFQLFKLIKIIADFKGVTYLVAFDDEAVAAALNDRFGSAKSSRGGHEFLEKIIQVPLHLPLIQHETLDLEVLNGVDAVLKENDIEISEEEVNDFRHIYDQALSPLMKTPRTVNRYLNSLKFTVPLVKGEVNIADFLIVEALRLFYPNLYARLRLEKQLLTGTLYHLYLRLDRENDKEEAKKLVDKLIEDEPIVKEIIKSLFPAIDKVYEKHSSGKSLSELRNDKRVASPDYYERYFSYGVGASDVSDTEILEIITQETAEEISKRIVQLLKTKKQELIIAKLRTYHKNAQKPLELAKSMLLSVGELSENKPTVFSRAPVEESVNVISDIVKELPDRLGNWKILVDECNDYEQLFFVIREVVLHSKEDSRERMLDKSELSDFQQHVVKKFRKESKKGPFHKVGSRGSHILYKYWQEIAGRDEVNSYLKSVIKTADDALDFLTLHLAKWDGSRGSHRGNLDTGAYGYAENVIDMDYLYGLITTEDPSSKDIQEFPDLEDTNVGRSGNESSKEFRDVLARQLVYQYEHANKSEGDVIEGEIV